MRWLSVVAALCAALLAVPPVTRSGGIETVAATLPASCGSGCEQHITVQPGWTITAFSNFPFGGSPQVTDAIIVIHGTGRNATGYFSGMMGAASKAGVTGHTMVLTPFFKTDQDKPAANEARWTSGGWKIGDAAEKPAGLSSFALMDSLVTTLADKQRFPNLNHITLVGHSAGAQFAQRYAIFGLGPNEVSGVGMNFVVANPSSYLYFDDDRPRNNGASFSAPSSGSCGKYNDYKYGMIGRTGYVARLTPQQALQQYTARRVTYLQGGADTVQNGDMDAGCEAMLEGPNRLMRGALYFKRIKELAPGALHDRYVVPNIAHDHDAMFDSPQALPLLFGKPASSS